MSVVEADLGKRRSVLREVMDAVMSGKPGNVARHFAPGAVVSSRSNAGSFDAPWFERLEGEFRLGGEPEAKAFLSELMRRATFISYTLRGIIIEDDQGASRCDWTKRDERDGSLVIGTTMYWFAFTSDDRIRSIESIGSIHSVIPATDTALAGASLASVPR
ncbi:nuclear transport factor 2 family protein [Aurantimonas sp. MSK8Z-1]|uniref:nuclear transport factor 2 family protein n=1 Tax=Mangrovibrevibacter kandeliae TaxID=2968473 RepID=UPI0021183B29|nr:nuclear transport factor 2 family protein [Aurantimonas sp. MSK8Z-1]MCW4116217.1 nuclear transport factor 2 family protein [Aurantimonas sp. MSK8Z-1]